LNVAIEHIVTTLAVTCGIAAISASCSSMTAPSCTDQEGRGSKLPSELDITTCVQDGNDVRCRAVATNRHDLYVYCPIDLDVTDQATWISSDTTVGVFDAPGHLKVLSAGQVQVSAKYGLLATLSYPKWLFVVAPGSVPQHIIRWGVVVDDGATRRSIVDAVVQLQPQSGPTQTCQTDSRGVCDFTIVAGTVQVQISKTGYQSAQLSLVASDDGVEHQVFLTPLP
jgi:hypothetical protein